MSTDYSSIDPHWAWSRYEPTPQRRWSRGLAAHLYRRAGFCADTKTLDAAVKAGPFATLAALCDPPANQGSFEATSAALEAQVLLNGNPSQLAAWWLYRMLNSADPLLEKLILFWHGHFATSVAKVQRADLMLGQNALLRQHARGNFEQLVRGISRDPAMLIYLDSTTNRRIHPNENYARELMELFTLGVGNYTEKDIKEIARAFTGWEIQGTAFHFDPVQHDVRPKSFLGKTGNFDGDDAVRIILEQPAAPRFIARKLIRFFVFDEPTVPDALVEPLAQELRQNQFRIGSTVERILSSNLFFSEYAIGRKVRSPVDLGVGLLVALGASTNLVRLAQGVSELGQALFAPPSVKGWDGGRTWINSSTLLGRANLVEQVLSASETTFGKSGGTLADAADRAGAKEPKEIVDWLLELLVAVPIPSAARAALVELATGGDRNTRINKVVHAISTLPEFQLC